MNQYLQKLLHSIIEHPDTPVYILLCGVFKSSGANLSEITMMFNLSMMVGKDYDEIDKKEMIEYVLKKANE